MFSNDLHHNYHHQESGQKHRGWSHQANPQPEQTKVVNFPQKCVLLSIIEQVMISKSQSDCQGSNIWIFSGLIVN